MRVSEPLGLREPPLILRARALIEQHHGAQQFIDLLFRPERVLLDFPPIVRSFTTSAMTPGHETHLVKWLCFA
jgi:hypothetical protein